MFFFINSGIGYTNTGVEHAIFNRLAIFRKFKQPAKLLSFEHFPELHDNIQKYNQKEDEIISMYDWFLDAQNIKYKEFLLKDYPIPDGMVEIEEKAENLRRFAFPDSNTTRILVRTQVDYKHVGWVNFYDSIGKIHTIDKYDSRGFKVFREQWFLNGKDNTVKSRVYYTPKGERRMEEIIGKNRLDDDAPVLIRLLNFKKTLSPIKKSDPQDYLFDGPQELLRFFLDDVNRAFGMFNSFLVDRGLNSSWSLFNMETPSYKSFILHSTHLSDENKPNGLTNYNYDNGFQHIHNYVNSVVTPTKVQLNKMVKRWGENEKWKLVPVGIIPEEHLKLPKKTAAQRNKHQLVTVSRLDPIKQISHIIRALKIVQETFPDATLDIYGTGSDRTNLEKTIEDLKMQKSVHLKGHTIDPTQAYYDAQLFVAAGNNEGFGLTMMEAQAVGTPIVAYDVPYGPKEIVVKGHSGELVPMGQKDSIKKYAQAILKILRDEDTLNKYIEGSYQDRQRYTEENVWQGWQSYIDDYNQWLDNQKKELTNELSNI
ncbi:MAG: glycosyltransferase [Lactobacillaceae bacterium]|jgi:poly(glycerol-phosphate) alpha-glucosyltransferase|nr:glycosyltransferase [Lactobacillaceae bacterium]